MIVNTVKISAPHTHIIAHRGLSGIERENTAAAFVAAGNRNYYGIETDLHVTKDGNYIIIHNDTTAAVTGVDLSVKETDFDTLRSLAVLDKDGELRKDLCLPSLEEYLKICKKYEKKAVLELKGRIPKAHLEKIVQKCEAWHSLEDMIFISFWYDNLADLRAMCPNVKLEFLTESEVNEDLLAKLQAHHLDLDIAHRHLTKENIAWLHENGITVNCYTVDSAKRAEALAAWGIDEITSNILQAE